MTKTKIEVDSQALDYRIYVHKNFSKSDFDAWVLNRLQLKNALSVLDVGCGTGKHLFDIGGKIGPQGAVVGIDISDVSLNKCKERIKEKGSKNISVIQADLAEISEKISGAKFDRALSSFAIYYTKNPQKTFGDLYAALNPSGLLFICGPTEKNNSEFLELVKTAGGKLSEDLLRWSHFLEHDACDILRKLFKEVKVEYFNNPVEFPDADTLLKYWKATPLYDASIEKQMFDLISEKFRQNKTFTSNKVIIGITCKKHD